MSQPRIAPAERRIWVLTGDKPGDNAQALSLAAALGWPTEVKRLRYLRIARRSLAERVAGARVDRFPLDREHSSPLAPPWPDLVIGCGRRSVGVTWDIRRQAGSATRLVQLGRPRADLDAFDLVITTPQYRLPARSNVLHLALPLHRPDPDAWARAGAEWAPRFARLPRPWFALLIGGSAKPFVFDAAAARRLAEQANALARAEGGSLLVSTSRRTPQDAARTLVDALAVPAYLHQWSAAGGPNPYLAYLALADGFVVTGDSASMLTEACSTGKRVWYVDLPQRRSPRSHVKNLFRRIVLAPTQHPELLGGSLARLAARLPARGWVRYPRDLRKLHAALVAVNRALPLGRSFAAPPPPPLDETARAVGRVRALFGE
ncbi:MAG: mitochondrial fission ELM1 family protein [Deltaproteobacteria bacterium]|nr:mitochondrial fission ELM1 family protein [Deltaproteobacteria bacterium]